MSLEECEKFDVAHRHLTTTFAKMSKRRLSVRYCQPFHRTYTLVSYLHE
jgi:hypothetical protein